MKIQFCACAVVLMLRTVLSAPTGYGDQNRDDGLSSRRLAVAMRLILLSNYLEKFKDLNWSPRQAQSETMNAADDKQRAQTMVEPFADASKKSELSTKTSGDSNKVLEDIDAADLAHIEMKGMNNANVQLHSDAKQTVIKEENVSNKSSVVQDKDMAPRKDDGYATDEHAVDIVRPKDHQHYGSTEDKVVVEDVERDETNKQTEEHIEKVMEEIEDLIASVNKQNSEILDTRNIQRVEKKDFAILPPASEWCRMMGFWRCGGNSS